MFRKLQEKWKVNGWQLFLVISTFALGGSLCGYLGKRLLAFSGLEKNLLWVLLYILVVTLLWPLCVLIISVPLGQYRFFTGYLRKLWNRMSGRVPARIRIAVFASGNGSNARRIMEHFRNHPRVQVQLVVCNNPRAGVIQLAKDAHIPVLIIEKQEFTSGSGYLPALREAGIDFLVLAGFLWKLPTALVEAYPRRIVNIHPALLPRYGGKGMYGHHVHEAVLAAGEKESGITIHFADEQYDHGQTIFQARCPVEPGDTPATLAARVQQLEHRHYPLVLESLLRGL